jgi:hypothetical protein
MKFSGKNPRLRKAAKRCVLFYGEPLKIEPLAMIL